MVAADLMQSKAVDESINEEGEMISLKTLSELTGFPKDFIRSELVIKEEELSLAQLRESVLKYLKDSDEDNQFTN